MKSMEFQAHSHSPIPPGQYGHGSTDYWNTVYRITLELDEQNWDFTDPDNPVQVFEWEVSITKDVGLYSYSGKFIKEIDELSKSAEFVMPYCKPSNTFDPLLDYMLNMCQDGEYWLGEILLLL